MDEVSDDAVKLTDRLLSAFDGIDSDSLCLIGEAIDFVLTERGYFDEEVKNG